MPTLGQRLKEQMDLRAEKAALNDKARTQHDRRLEERDRRRIDAFFREILEDLEDAVADDRPFHGRRVPNSEPFFDTVTAFHPVWHPSHPHHDIYKHHVSLARLNGLVWNIVHEHDGYGMEAWFTATLEPMPQ